MIDIEGLAHEIAAAIWDKRVAPDGVADLVIGEWENIAAFTLRKHIAQPAVLPQGKSCEVCGATELLTVMGPNQYACPKHRATSSARPTQG